MPGKNTLVSISGSQMNLNQWWKKGKSKGGFVLPYYVENQEKFYIFGNETVSGWGWAPFGGKCDAGEDPLTNAAREFLEESGLQKTWTLERMKVELMKKTKPTDRFAALTNPQNKEKPNLMIYYFVEWNKEEILNAFKNRDGEMTAFGSISESNLKQILSELNSEISKNKSFDADRFLLNKKGIVKNLTGTVTTDGLRGLISYLRVYIQNPSSEKIPTFASGEKYFDLTLK